MVFENLQRHCIENFSRVLGIFVCIICPYILYKCTHKTVNCAYLLDIPVSIMSQLSIYKCNNKTNTAEYYFNSHPN